MNNNNIEKVSFYEYLTEYETKLLEELDPYYEKLRAREKACMNTYGIETPKDKILLDELVSIKNLKKKMEDCNGYQELISKVKHEIEKCQNKNRLSELNTQMSILKKYLEIQKEAENNKDIDVKNKLSK